MRRVGFFILIFGFVFLVLTGCGRGNSSDDNNLSQTIIGLSKVLQTGQTQCYGKINSSKTVNCTSSNALHDDGWYTTIKHLGVKRSYKRNNATKIVTDNATGLMWQDNINVTTVTKTWQSAKGYCSNLTFGGYNDWRLPTAKELSSIADYGKANPAINDNYFKNAISGYYWSATFYKAYLHNAWYVHFYDGDVYNYSKDAGGYVRCVRGK